MQDIVRNFIELFRDLVNKEPHLAVHNFRCENSDYSDQLNDSKNAYLCFNGYDLEDCYYLADSRWNKNCTDMSYSNKCELCYDCLDCDECYNCDFCQDCERCVDCRHCYDCLACKNCFGCVGLRNEEYQIFNHQYSRDDYEKELLLAQKKVVEKIENIRESHPHLAMRNRRTENCFGNYVYDSKNSNFIFKSYGLEDCLYTCDSGKLMDCVDTDMTFKSELMYEAIEDTDNYNCNFLYWSAFCQDCEYVMYCFNCKNCFGCFNQKYKEFHILNRPYTEDEYKELTTAIKTDLAQKGLYTNFMPDL